MDMKILLGYSLKGELRSTRRSEYQPPLGYKAVDKVLQDKAAEAEHKEKKSGKLFH